MSLTSLARMFLQVVEVRGLQVVATSLYLGNIDSVSASVPRSIMASMSRYLVSNG